MIRQATRGDAAAIADIYNHYVANTVVSFETESVTAEAMSLRLAEGGALYPWLVAEEDGSVQGFAYATRWKSRSAYDRTVETSVYLATDAIGKGLGTDLYRALLEQLRSDGFHCALGGIALPNPASVALHEKLGFRKVGELQEVGWKQDRWVNVGYWQLIL